MQSLMEIFFSLQPLVEVSRQSHMEEFFFSLQPLVEISLQFQTNMFWSLDHDDAWWESFFITAQFAEERKTWSWSEDYIHKLRSHRKYNKCLTNQGATGNVTRLVWFTWLESCSISKSQECLIHSSKTPCQDSQGAHPWLLNLWMNLLIIDLPSGILICRVELSVEWAADIDGGTWPAGDSCQQSDRLHIGMDCTGMWIKERGWRSWEPCSCWSRCISQSCSWTSFISTPWHHQLHSFCHTSYSSSTSSSSSRRRIPLKLLLQWHGSSSCWFNQSVIKYFHTRKQGKLRSSALEDSGNFFPLELRNFQRQSLSGFHKPTKFISKTS